MHHARYAHGIYQACPLLSCGADFVLQVFTVSTCELFNITPSRSNDTPSFIFTWNGAWTVDTFESCCSECVYNCTDRWEWARLIVNRLGPLGVEATGADGTDDGISALHGRG